MTTHTNYMNFNNAIYGTHDVTGNGPTLKDEVQNIIYPALGTLGTIYQLYLLLFG